MRSGEAMEPSAKRTRLAAQCCRWAIAIRAFYSLRRPMNSRRTFPGLPTPRQRPVPTNATAGSGAQQYISTLITDSQQCSGTFEMAPWFIRSAPPCDAGSPATLPLTGPSVVVSCRVVASLRLIPCIAAPHHGRALILLLPLRSPTCAVGLSSGCFLPPR